jgi:RND family efflux transporter MFP subunit
MKRYIFLIVLIIFIITAAWILRNNKKILNEEGLLSESEIEVLPVSVEKVMRGDLERTFKFSGILKPRKDLMVISQTQGQVEEVRYELGDYVTKGVEIVKVEDDLLSAQLKVAEANFEKAQKDIERFEKMAEIDGVTKDQLEKMRLNLKNAEAQYITVKKRLEDTSIKAPFNGYINQIFTKNGSMLGPGAPVFEIVDISGFKMTIKCTADEIIHIVKGMDVKVTPKIMEGIELSGYVSKVSVSADMAQQYTVEILIDQSTHQPLKGGMVAVADISGSAHKDIIAISKGCIFDENGQDFVFKIIDAKAVRTAVTTGSQLNNMMEIKDGLVEGDLVVSSGIRLLSDGRKVNIME